ncbi:MAG: hypothetical protein ACR2QO_28225 [Acidimicrobiales bacterium]
MTAAVAYRSNDATAPRRASSKRSSAARALRPQLRVVDQAAIRRRARRRNAAVVLFMVLLSGLFIVAFVHAQLVATQQQLDETRSEIAELRNERARLERAVDEASSPALIVDRASELGMVRAAQPVFLVSADPAFGAQPEAVAATEARPETALGGIGDG